MHKYVIMGVQGCGKGTQAKLLCEAYGWTHISVGDIFRWNIQAHTKLAAKVKRIMEAGELVPDDIVEEVIRRRLEDHDWNFGFILDGFPRNAEQATFFLERYDIDAVIHIAVPDEVVMQRVLARRKCANCGLDYNLIHHRPREEGVCDVCGGQLVCRTDDRPEAVRQRLADYHEKTAPVLDLFSRKELIVTADGTADIEGVHAEIKSRLGIDDPQTAGRDARSKLHIVANAGA